VFSRKLSSAHWFGYPVTAGLVGGDGALGVPADEAAGGPLAAVLGVLESAPPMSLLPLSGGVSSGVCSFVGFALAESP
jgi:hypothetical protein